MWRARQGRGGSLNAERDRYSLGVVALETLERVVAATGATFTVDSIAYAGRCKAIAASSASAGGSLHTTIVISEQHGNLGGWA